jgi:hypothetical protein
MMGVFCGEKKLLNHEGTKIQRKNVVSRHDFHPFAVNFDRSTGDLGNINTMQYCRGRL